MHRKILVTTAYYLAAIALGLFAAVEGPALPLLAQHTRSRVDQISLIFLIGGFGYLVGSYISGRVYDLIPGHRFMAVIFLGLALLGAIVPIVTVLWLLVAVSFLLGLSKGAIDVGCNTLLIWVHDHKVSPFMNGLHAFFGIGAFLSPLMVARVIKLTGDIHWVYWSFVIVCLPVGVLLWVLPSPEKRAFRKSGEAFAAPTIPLLLMFFCFVVYVGAEFSFGNWLYVYAMTRGLGTYITSAYLISAFWGSFTLARLAGIWLSKRYRPATTLYLDLFGSIASVVLILLMPDSVTMLWIGSILLGIFMASVFPSLLNLAEERIHVTGTITSWFMVGSGVGGMLIPWLIGQVFVPFGSISMILIVLASLVLNLIALFMFINQKSAI